jgi:hypothetical protein
LQFDNVVDFKGREAAVNAKKTGLTRFDGV